MNCIIIYLFCIDNNVKTSIHDIHSADSTYNSAIINTNVIVSNDGNVTWLSHGIYKSSCDIDVEYFPFDIQICKLMWASWTYDGRSVRN